MKPKINIKSLLLGAVLAIAVVMSIAAAVERGVEWEYKVVTGIIYGGANESRLETAINNHVAQGWQFVSTSGVGERSAYAVMRREKE